MRTLATAVPGADRRRLRVLAGLERPDTQSQRAARAIGLLDRHPRRMAGLAGLVGAVAFGPIGGPVAALAGGVYAAVAVTVVASMRRSRARTAEPWRRRWTWWPRSPPICAPGPTRAR